MKVFLTKDQNGAGGGLGPSWVFHRQGVVATIGTRAEPDHQLAVGLRGLDVGPGGHLGIVLFPGDRWEGDSFYGGHQCDVGAGHGLHLPGHPSIQQQFWGLWKTQTWGTVMSLLLQEN